MVKEYRVKLLRKEKIAKDTWLFAWEKPKGYVFTPGQYQTFSFPAPNGKADWRDMTITSSPHQNELWLVTKIHSEASEFKKTLLNLPVGSSIKLEGPSGGFTLRDEKPHVFLAGGIGVNVFHSILMDAANKNMQTPMILLVSFSIPEDMVFYDALKKAENDKRKIIYTLTRITDKTIKKYIPDFQENIFMIAGGQEFVDAMNELLLKMSVPQENIRIDYFTGY